MKIALIRNRFSPGHGGAEKVAARFVDAFIAKGHEITVFAEKFRALAERERPRDLYDTEITGTPFVPKHEVELTPAGPISIRELT